MMMLKYRAQVIGAYFKFKEVGLCVSMETYQWGQPVNQKHFVEP